MGFNESPAFDIEPTTWFKAEPISQRLTSRSRDMDTARLAMAFHALCDIYCISPYIIDELLRAEYSGDQRTGVEADPHLKLNA